jgi:hypothetical protein
LREKERKQSEKWENRKNDEKIEKMTKKSKNWEKERKIGPQKWIRFLTEKIQEISAKKNP